MYVNDWGAQNFKKSSSHQKVLDTRRVIWNKFSTENPKKLGVNVKKNQSPGHSDARYLPMAYTFQIIPFFAVSFPVLTNQFIIFRRDLQCNYSVRLAFHPL